MGFIGGVVSHVEGAGGVEAVEGARHWGEVGKEQD